MRPCRAAGRAWSRAIPTRHAGDTERLRADPVAIEVADARAAEAALQAADRIAAVGVEAIDQAIAVVLGSVVALPFAGDLAAVDDLAFDTGRHAHARAQAEAAVGRRAGESVVDAAVAVVVEAVAAQVDARGRNSRHAAVDDPPAAASCNARARTHAQAA